MTTQTASHSSVASASDIATARQLIDAFEQSQAPGVWPHLEKAEVIATLRDRIANPFRLDQKQQPFCGPTSIVFELIRKQPIRYVHMCQQLFEQGKFQGYTRTVEAPYQLRENSRGMDMAQADWMLIATMRESENLLFKVDPNAPTLVRNIAGMTKSWEMKGWTKEILGYANVEYYHAYLLRDISAMQKAKAAIAQGGVAFALVTAGGMYSKEDMLTRSDSKSVKKVAMPDHWIVLVDIEDIPATLSWRGVAYRSDKTTLKFDTFTWARRVPVDIGRAAFRRFFWGVVIGQP
ncbi:MAG: hypothetical protein VKL39_22430 [Leptolyngbyaceae bacterium]|nr:hypothetical protein [Leptolyngbyaceae bacterium]